MEEKKALRKHIKSLKGSMDKSDLLAYSHALFSQLERSERFQKAHTVLCYYSLPDEVFTHEFVKKYDKVFCNFPFGLKFNQTDLDIINNNKNEIEYKFTNRISSCWAFINSIISSLSSKGKAIAVMPNAGLYKYPDADYRKMLVEKGYVEAVISLPEKVFAPYTSIPVTILILSRNNKKIKFINAEKMILKEELNKTINEIDIKAILEEYESISNTDNTKIVNVESIANNNYSLYTPNYMEVEKIDIKNPLKLSAVCNEIYRGYQVSSRKDK